MKLNAKLFFVILLLEMAFLQVPAAANDPIRVFVNGNELIFTDSQPQRDSNGSTLVPARAFAGAMGCELDWDGETGAVTLKRGAITAEMVVGNNEYSVLGVYKPMNTAAIVLNGRALVPVRFAAEAFGAVVIWDDETKAVIITDKGNDIYRLGNFVWDIEESDVLENNSDGLLTIKKQTGLILDERQVGEDHRTVLVIEITMDTTGKSTEDQLIEAGALLRQCLDDKLVDEVISYASTKEDSQTVIERKYFSDGEYRIYVTGYIGPVVIYVYL